MHQVFDGSYLQIWCVEDGRTDGRKDNVKTVYPPKHSLRGCIYLRPEKVTLKYK